jgi:hypothetical protein
MAWSPAITAAGSPSAMYNRLNTNSATIAITRMVAKMRPAGWLRGCPVRLWLTACRPPLQK